MDQPGLRDITLDHLLRMSSGLAWNEGYEASPLNSSVIAMLYTWGRQDMATFTASMPLRHPAGTVWRYSSGTTNLLAGVLRKVVGDEGYRTYPWDRLLNRLGMDSVVWERDQSGTFVGSSYLYATPRDLARFGLLYMRDGVWKGERILPEGWVSYSTQLAPAYRTMPLSKEDQEDRPGAHWWLNVSVPERGLARAWPDAPEDCFAALGHWGQSIFVLPSQRVVIVRTGDDRDGSFDKNEFLKRVLAALRS
jgi:CubicO group peptidase (beta-lactamase class C family)